MVSSNFSFEQDVINESADIYSRICTELRKAEHSILIASAWFTDPELFSLIKFKAKEGVKIDLIIADNEENRKLDFNELVAIGGDVLRIKNVGYGMMHQKFCVIDNLVAIHGSYNWSVNARKNNHESIIVTNHKQTIQSLVEVFNKIKNKALEKKPDQSFGLKNVLNTFLNRQGRNEVTEDLSELSKLDLILKLASENAKNSKVEEEVNTPYLQYEKVLDSMISAEVSAYDRALLRNQGFERSKLNNGDSQVLDNSLDTVYSVFINDIDVIDDKKKRLIGKINEQKVKTTDFLQIKLEIQLNKIETDTEEIKASLFQKITNHRSNSEVLEADIISIETNKIQPLFERNLKIKDEIKEKECEYIIPKHRIFDLIPCAILNGILLIYLILFYSSAAYILIFAENDAKALNLGSMTPIPSVFNPNALTQALNTGVVSLVFILLFPFLPIAISIAERFEIVSQKKSQWISYAGIIIIDIFLAIQVSKAIHNIKYEAGKIRTAWSWSDVYLDINAYLVLVLGAAGLLIFKVAYKKLMCLFEERNPDLNHQKNTLFIAQLEKEIVDNISSIQDFKLEIDAKDKQIILEKAEKLLLEAELDNLPLKKANEIEKRKSEFHSKLQNIAQVTDIYISHVENDNLPISVDSLKDRINVFLEGWNDYLHSEFAISKAVEKSSNASDVSFKWLEFKLANSKLDKRIKL